MTVVIHNSDTSDYIEITRSKCFELESKLNASRYVDRWSDLGDKLYNAGTKKLDLISVPNNQFIFLKTALVSSLPTDIKPLRKIAFDEDDSPKFEWAKKDESKSVGDKYKDVPRYDLGSKRVVGFMVPLGAHVVGIMPFKY
jgi:hypothetical protein